jgi:hypothetical protein
VDEKIRQTITKYLGDLRALESHGAEAISRQIDDIRGKNHPEALRAFEDFKQTLDAHVNALDSRLTALGSSPTSPVKAVVASAAGVIAGIYGSLRNEAASKMLRDDYAFLSLDAISYLMLHTTALSLGDVDTANVVERGYRDCARMVMDIDRIIPDVVLKELLQDGLPAKDVTAECRHLISSSWQRQPPPSVRTQKAV